MKEHDNHGGWGLCGGRRKVWVDDGDRSNWYEHGSCPECSKFDAVLDPFLPQKLEKENKRLREALLLISAIRPGRCHDEVQYNYYCNLSDNERVIYDMAEGHAWSRAWERASDIATKALNND